MVTLQCSSEIDRETFKMMKRVLEKNFTEVKFVKSFIPSYCMNWIFASAKAA